MDSADFDADEVDEDGLPLVYNEQRIASFWKGRPGELASRWARFGAVAGVCSQQHAYLLVVFC